jgi:hypothetical protein
MADAADFRRIALSFEGAGEYPHFDRRAFKARVTFARLAPDELSANIKFAPDEQALKCAVAPDAQRSGTQGRAENGLAPCGAEGEGAQAALRPNRAPSPHPAGSRQPPSPWGEGVFCL